MEGRDLKKKKKTLGVRSPLWDCQPNAEKPTPARSHPRQSKHR